MLSVCTKWKVLGVPPKSCDDALARSMRDDAVDRTGTEEGALGPVQRAQTTDQGSELLKP